MKLFFKILINHKWAIFLAVLVGLIMVFPQAYFRYAHQDVYQGIEMNLKGADEIYYLTRIQEIRDGHFSLASPFWAEGKDLPYLNPPGSEILAAFLGQIFGLNLINTVLLERFLFPAMIFLLIYALLYCLTRKKSVALVAATTVLLATELVNPGALWDLLIHQKADYHFLLFSHLISPQTHLLFFFGFLLFFWLFLEKEKKIYGIISSIILGLSFYTYPYTWTFICAFLGLLIVIFIWQKKWLWVRNIILLTLGGLLIAIPYFWNLYQAIQFPSYPEVSVRFGVIESHSPIIGIVVIALLVFFLLFFPVRREKRYYFSLVLVLTPLVVLNQQIITGKIIIPAHYHWYFHRPLFIIILLIIIFEQLARIKKPPFKRIVWSGLVVLVLLVNFYNALMVQAFSYKAHQAETIDNQQYASIFQWLNNYSQSDEVVMANPTISNLVTIYTSLNSLTNPDAHFSLIANEEELLERVFLQYRFNGLKTEDAETFFLKNKSKISGDIYGQYYRKKMGGYDKIPDAKIYWIVNKYKEFLNVSIENVLRKYQTKYLIWDILNQPNWQIDKYSFLKEVYSYKNVKIYELIEQDL